MSRVSAASPDWSAMTPPVDVVADIKYASPTPASRLFKLPVVVRTVSP